MSMASQAKAMPLKPQTGNPVEDCLAAEWASTNNYHPRNAQTCPFVISMHLRARGGTCDTTL